MTRIPRPADVYPGHGQETQQRAPSHLGDLTHQGHAGHQLGQVEAPDAKTAIEEAIRKFGIKERIRDRLAARQVNRPNGGEA
jgi:hypothetical protein